MKIDGEVRWERAAATAALTAQGASTQQLRDTFRAALQRSRRPGAQGPEESRARPTERERVRVVMRPPDRSGRVSASLDAESADATSGALMSTESRARLLTRPADSGERSPILAAEYREPPRARRTGGTGPGTCIEVVHARTGTRFVLSRDGDAWLLAVESEHSPHPAELASVIAMLNARFAARGLGPIDVLMI